MNLKDLNDPPDNEYGSRYGIGTTVLFRIGLMEGTGEVFSTAFEAGKVLYNLLVFAYTDEYRSNEGNSNGLLNGLVWRGNKVYLKWLKKRLQEIWK